jgi:hypothetical protein
VRAAAPVPQVPAAPPPPGRPDAARLLAAELLALAERRPLPSLAAAEESR